MEIVLILPDIRSVYNVGSLFRTADAAGVSKLFLTGYTPLPIDRFGRVRKDLAKVALGAEKTVPWEAIDDLLALTERLQEKNYLVLALEQTPDAENVFGFHLPSGTEKIALVLGNEVRGVPPEVLALADHVLEIPMHGSKESLNISVAAGIALFMLLNNKR